LDAILLIIVCKLIIVGIGNKTVISVNGCISVCTSPDVSEWPNSKKWTVFKLLEMPGMACSFNCEYKIIVVSLMHFNASVFLDIYAFKFMAHVIFSHYIHVSASVVIVFILMLSLAMLRSMFCFIGLVCLHQSWMNFCDIIGKVKKPIVFNKDPSPKAKDSVFVFKDSLKPRQTTLGRLWDEK